MKSSKRILALLLAIVFIAGAAPPAFAAAGDPGEDSSGGAAGLCLVEDAAGLAAPTALTPDYTLNDADGGWADGEIKLDDAGDELILLADSGPLAPVKISVTAPSGSSVTITGRVGVTYENLYMEVLSDNLTLYLENLNIKAPEGKWGGNNGYRGLQFKSDTDYACITISAEGNCVIEGGDYLTASGGGGYGGTGYSSSIKTGPSVKGLTLHTAGDGQIQFIGGDGKWAGLGVNTPGAIIEADTVVQAGNAEATESSSGMQISGDLTIKNKLSVYGGGVAAADVNGGTGLVFGDGGSLTFESGGS
ncbi:MAG: hypothetical protein AAGU77_13195, partial [Bacillota bacterium]